MHPSRREFLAGCAAAAAVGFPRVARARNLNSRLQVACVGVDGIATLDMAKIGSHPAVKFVGLCDIDSNRFAKADAAFPGVPHFADYREMLATLGAGCDAVLIDTPDHMHAPIAVAAMQAGKHVYCQKPLTHTLWEARQMRRWAEKTGVATQMGNQIHSAVEYRLATRLLRDRERLRVHHASFPSRARHAAPAGRPPCRGHAAAGRVRRRAARQR